MGLGYSCDETGSQVLQLTQLIQPLDACDANPVNCADPTVMAELAITTGLSQASCGV